MILYTLGHSNHPIEKFLGLLQGSGIQRLMDVRSAPYSRFHPQFNKKNLAEVLPSHGVEYILSGETLGGRPGDPTCYRVQSQMIEGGEPVREVDYFEVMQREWFQEGIARLLELAGGKTTAILCSEEDPVRCHRHHLIAYYLREIHPGIEVMHIRGNGNIQSAGLLWDNDSRNGSKQLRLF
jgi:uncharacterized protein (DUF488 family)